MTPFLAALLGLGINQGAYTSEVVRAGLLSVDTGQYEAAKSIGMPRLQALRRVILPQAMRVIVPPIGNELVGMVKLTSLASVIQYAEMLHNAENIYYANARVIELLMVAGIWYLVVVTVLSLLQSRVERFSRAARVAPVRDCGRPTPCVDPRSSGPIVHAVDVRKSYGDFKALHGITLDVTKGEVLCVIGPSGSGKSTFLRCINQLETINARRVVGQRRTGRLPARREQAVSVVRASRSRASG